MTYVPGSCTGTPTCSVTGNTITWDLGSLAIGATGSRSYQVTVSPTATNGQTFTNSSQINEAETDVAFGDNSSSVTTTVSVTVGSITGSVLNDLNGNGADNSDPGLANATVQLFRDTNSNGSFDSGTDAQVGANQTTPSSGTFSFAGLTADTYFVVETNPSGFVSTAALFGTNGASTVNSDQIKVVLAAGATSANSKFLDQERDASIAGTVYNDLNGNGAFDAGEPGISGVTVSRSGGTPSSSGAATTDGSGNYSLSGLAAGTYSVDYTPPSGFVNTGTKPISVILSAGQAATGQNLFAQQQNASIAGTVYNDANGNGSADLGESGKSTVTVFLDTNNSGSLDGGETSTSSAGNGSYSFSGLTAGTYHVSYVVPGGWVNTGTRPLDQRSITTPTATAAPTWARPASRVSRLP